MDKEKLIEKLRSIYDMGKDHMHLEMYGDLKLDGDAEKFFNEMAENIILSFRFRDSTII